MIARFWRGATRAADRDTYLEYLHRTGVADILKLEGNRGIRLLHRLAGDQAEFLFVSFWDSLDAIHAFAGPDIQSAVYYPEDRKYLLELTPEVVHYEMETFDALHRHRAG